MLPGDAAQLVIGGSVVLTDAHVGDSIAVDGVCLTVAAFSDGGFMADVMKPTLQATTVRRFMPGRRVNLERATRADSRMGGHIVSGHVDCEAVLVSRVPAEHWQTLRFDLPIPQWRQLAVKGSVAVNGTSLTVGDVGETADGGHWFEVSLIPTTLDHTVLGGLDVGAAVNIETDVLAKYVERLLSGDAR